MIQLDGNLLQFIAIILFLGGQLFFVWRRHLIRFIAYNTVFIKIVLEHRPVTQLIASLFP